MSQPRTSFRRRYRVGMNRRHVLLLVLVAIIVVGAGYLGMQALRAKSALTDAADQAKTLQQQITDGDTAAAKSTLRALQTSTHKAMSNTDGPAWALLGKLPFVGDSVDAVRTISASLDDISRQGLPPVVEAASALDADLFKPKDGRVDVAQLAKLAPSVTTASDVLTSNQAKLSDIEPDSLIGPLTGPVSELKDKIDSAQSTASAASRAMRLMPNMLGAGGRRTYLLMFQNNAEARSTGGLPGAFAIIRANKGKISIIRQGSGTSFPQLEVPVVDLTKDELESYGELMATDFRDTNFTPDFPRTAVIASAMVKKQLGIAVSGVLSIDPVALSYLLRGTGPIKTADDTQLTSQNAVSLLLNDVYARYPDPKDQDRFFADSARLIFEAVTRGQGDSRKVLDNLLKASAEHRVLLWSPLEDEQAILAPTRVSGALVGDSERPHVGLYLIDQTASKMQYYLDTKTEVTSKRCTDDRRQVLQARTTLTSTAPADAKQLPGYIVGGGTFSRKGTMVMEVRLFAPAGGKLVSATVNGKPRALNASSLNGRPMQTATVRLEPGQKATLVTVMNTAPDQPADAVFSTTPGAHPTANGVRIRSSCE